MPCGTFSRGTAPRILKLSIRWSWVVSFMPQPRKEVQHPLDRRVGRSRWRSWRSGGYHIPAIQPADSHSTDWTVLTKSAKCTPRKCLHDINTQKAKVITAECIFSTSLRSSFCMTSHLYCTKYEAKAVYRRFNAKQKKNDTSLFPVTRENRNSK